MANVKKNYMADIGNVEVTRPLDRVVHGSTSVIRNILVERYYIWGSKFLCLILMPRIF